MAPQAPEGRLARLYQRQEVDGVEVFLPPGLMLNAPALTIRLAGFWRFKWLRVLGVASPAACAC